MCIYVHYVCVCVCVCVRERERERERKKREKNKSNYFCVSIVHIREIMVKMN